MHNDVVYAPGDDEVQQWATTDGDTAPIILVLDPPQPDRIGFASFVAIGELTSVYIIDGSGGADWLGIVRRSAQDEMMLYIRWEVRGKFADGSRVIVCSRKPRRARN